MTAELCPHCGKKTYFAEGFCCHCRCDKATGMPGNPMRTQALIDAAILRLRESMPRKMAAVAEAEKQAEADAKWRRWSEAFKG